MSARQQAWAVFAVVFALLAIATPNDWSRLSYAIGAVCMVVVGVFPARKP